MRSLTALVLVLTLLTPLTASAQQDAAPANDDFADAMEVPELPFSVEQDVSGATSEPTETWPSCALNPQTHLPMAGLGIVLDASSTWFRHTPSADTLVTFEVLTAPRVSIGVHDITDLGAAPAPTPATEVDCVRRADGPHAVRLSADRTYALQVVLHQPTPTQRVRMIPVDEADLAAQVGGVTPFEVTAADGTVLRGHVHLPAGGGPFTPVLELGPYFGTDVGAPTDLAIVDDPVRLALLRAGFAVALINVRGTGDSTGCLQVGGPVEGSDAGAVVEALAAAPWSTGRVGMAGAGYAAWSAMQAIASGAAPSLGAVVAISPIVDLWSVFTTDGAQHDDLAAGQSRYAALRTARLNQPLGQQPLAAEHVGCTAHADRTASDSPVWAGDRTDWYRDRDLRDGLEGSDVPVLATIGLQRDNPDGIPRDSSIRQADQLWGLLDGPRWFILGQHGEATTTATDFAASAIAWLDHHLDAGNRQPGRPDHPPLRRLRVDVQSDDGSWHTSRSWSPTGSGNSGPSRPSRAAESAPGHRRTVLHLDGGQLRDVEPIEDTNRSLQADNHAPLGCEPETRGGDGQGSGPTDAPAELVLTSAPLDGDLFLAGQFTLDLTISSSLPDGTLSGMLYVGEPCGDMREVSHAVVSLRHALDERGRDFPVDTPTRVQVDSAPFATTINKGERLVLALGSAGWTTLPDPILPRLTISTGPTSGSRLLLPNTFEPRR